MKKTWAQLAYLSLISAGIVCYSHFLRTKIRGVVYFRIDKHGNPAWSPVNRSPDAAGNWFS